MVCFFHFVIRFVSFTFRFVLFLDWQVNAVRLGKVKNSSVQACANNLCLFAGQIRDTTIDCNPQFHSDER